MFKPKNLYSCTYLKKKTCSLFIVLHTYTYNIRDIPMAVLEHLNIQTTLSSK